MENSIWINALAFLTSYFAMEGVAWATHKYVIHGFLWTLHESHHQPRHGVFERNDFFFLFYATIAMVLMYFGWEQLDFRFWMGLGVTAYGFTYFMLHDVFIHRRGKWLDKLDNSYFRAMRTRCIIRKWARKTAKSSACCSLTNVIGASTRIEQFRTNLVALPVHQNA